MKGPSIDWWAEERAAIGRGFTVVAGIDEAGRGPLAGPVVAAAVILPLGAPLEGVRDSKQMTPEQRSASFEMIQERALGIGVGVVDVATIDRLNILRASHQAMRDAVAALHTAPDHALIDGLPVHPFPILQTALVKGDGRSASIAAASIIAKVTRDRLMDELHVAYPVYGFSSHKGYTTQEHLELLEKHGPCEIHRRSFAPVARLLGLEGGVGRQTLMSFEGEDRQATGLAGETLAANHLQRLGWEILCQRFRCREGEIDLIARDLDTVVFCEVKTLRGRKSNPAESVTSRKRARLLAAAEAWLCDRQECACRFDVAEVRILPDGFVTVELLRDAFRPGE
jgi:ribonuclease HII